MLVHTCTAINNIVILFIIIVGVCYVSILLRLKYIIKLFFFFLRKIILINNLVKIKMMVVKNRNGLTGTVTIDFIPKFTKFIDKKR